jgi:hypothetical protein
MLFILAMEPLNYILKKAEEMNVLSHLPADPFGFRVFFLYADDVALFIKPTNQDLANLRSLLDFFLG